MYIILCEYKGKTLYAYGPVAGKSGAETIAKQMKDWEMEEGNNLRVVELEDLSTFFDELREYRR